MKTAYQCFATGEYIGPIDCWDEVLPNGATWDCPPDAKEGFARFYRNGKWEFVEDHRKEDGYVNGVKTTIHEVGPLPEGWSTEPPAPTVDEARAWKTSEINAAYSAALAASLTMPSVTAPPSPTEVAVNAAAWAADDAEGYAELLAIHAARREELLAAVAAAQTAAEVEAVPVTFNV